MDDPANITPAAPLQQTTYWQSPEAIALFQPLIRDNNAKDTLQRCVTRLQSVNASQDGWRNVVNGRDPDNFCSANDIFIIQQRSAILCWAYRVALERMND